MNPSVRYVKNKNKQKKRSTGTNLWTAKPARKSATLKPWGTYAAGKKEKKNESRWGRPVGCKAKTGSTTGDPWGQVQSSKEGGSEKERSRLTKTTTTREASTMLPSD